MFLSYCRRTVALSESRRHHYYYYDYYYYYYYYDYYSDYYDYTTTTMTPTMLAVTECPNPRYFQTYRDGH
jgi:hypothetical protein